MQRELVLLLVLHLAAASAPASLPRQSLPHSPCPPNPQSAACWPRARAMDTPCFASSPQAAQAGRGEGLCLSPPSPGTPHSTHGQQLRSSLHLDIPSHSM